MSGDPILRHVTTSIGFHIVTCPYTAKPDYDLEAATVGQDQGDIETEVLINWRASSGFRVYPQYKYEHHVARRALPYDPEEPLYCAWDFGLSPAFLVSQLNPFGQWCLFPSLHPEERGFEGIYAFGEHVADHLQRHYGTPFGRSLDDVPMVHIGDPAGRARTERPTGSKAEAVSCYEVLFRGMEMHLGEDDAGRPIIERKKGWGWRLVPGEMQVKKRIEAVQARLATTLRDGLPALLIDPREEFIQSCFGGLYHYQQHSDGTYDRQPKKDRASHIMNCVEYCASRLFYKPAAKEEADEEQGRREPFRSQAASRANW